jgi:hypothetical protein
VLKRTVLFALALLLTSWWPMLVGAQTTPRQKTAKIHVYEGPG